MDSTSDDERRINRRRPVSLSAVIKGRESDDFFWKETAEVTTVSRSGASFKLQRTGAVGQLVSLLLPMPMNLRCYDYKSEFYRVWGVIQHCSSVPDGYLIGVAFIGKEVPASYKENPLQSYRILGMDRMGMWKVTEASKAFIARKHPRYWKSLKARLTIFFDLEGKNILAEEEATTKNVSLSGAAVVSNLEVSIGDHIQFTSFEPAFSSSAIVRNRFTPPIGEATIHLEFIENEFPIKSLVSPSEEMEREMF